MKIAAASLSYLFASPYFIIDIYYHLRVFNSAIVWMESTVLKQFYVCPMVSLYANNGMLVQGSTETSSWQTINLAQILWLRLLLECG